jgi:acetyl-CoA carboxylase beta subunit
MVFDQVNPSLVRICSQRPIKFVDSKPYPERMREAQSKTGETEALVVMQGSLNHIPMVACALNLISWAVQWVQLWVIVLFKRLNVQLN